MYTCNDKKMGTSQSKEKVIIAQAGNSGRLTNIATTRSNGITLRDRIKNLTSNSSGTLMLWKI